VRACAATLIYRGCADLKDKTIAGLSGITREGDGETYLAVMDNSDRLVRLKIATRDDGSIASAEVVGEIRLGKKADREGIAYDARGRRFFISDESPAIIEHRAGDGGVVRSLEVPGIFRKHLAPNQGFESLSLSPDGKTLWTANERALTLDGNLMSPADPISATTRVRLLQYDVRGDAIAPRRQFEYITSGVHDWGGQVGLCDLVALDDGRLLALERSAAMNFQRVASIRTRIFLIDVSGAIDVSDRALRSAATTTATIGPATTQAVRTSEPGKEFRLFDGFVCGQRGANLEGLCLGRSLGRMRWSVLGVVDSSDGGLGLSRSCVAAFELDLAAPDTSQTPAPATSRANSKAPVTPIKTQ
jgi:hypothetical protein